MDADEGFPRIRGGGPRTTATPSGQSLFSPHTRGWSVAVAAGVAPPSVFPAYAGVVQWADRGDRAHRRFPRIRGGGPSSPKNSPTPGSFSPHTRGWSREVWLFGECDCVFPAYAGVVPVAIHPGLDHAGFPRIRGGGPGGIITVWRGTPFSPHTRGWSHVAVDRVAVLTVFPAYAGVVPAGSIWTTSASGFPRIRGGGPITFGLENASAQFSPHTRGWSQHQSEPSSQGSVFPAYAGVVPTPARQRSTQMRFPRIRGGGPCRADGKRDAGQFSPHTRGWSAVPLPLLACRVVFPAYAGVVPHHPNCKKYSTCFPRIRGGGPGQIGGAAAGARFSPHTRGWSSHRRRCAKAGRRFPRIRGGGPTIENLPGRRVMFSLRTWRWSVLPVSSEFPPPLRQRNRQFPASDTCSVV